MKVLITGANGQLGQSIRKLQNEFSELDFIYTDIQELDILSEKELHSFLKIHKPDFLINCAAYTAVDKAEVDKDLAYKLNAVAPGLLSSLMNKIKGKMIHISTDYVFNGLKGSQYTENDPITANSVYGKTKSEGEKKVLSHSQNFVVRTSWLYSEFGGNFFKTMHKLLSEKTEIGVVNDQYGTPTYAEDLARTLLNIVRLSSEEKIHPGIYHYSNKGIASWHDFASQIGKLISSSCHIKKLTTEEYPLPAPRPPYSVLSKNKIKKAGIIIPDWKDSLELCLKNYMKLSNNK